MRRRLWAPIALIASLTWSAAQAHEFWIEPQTYQIAPNNPLVADIKVGDRLEGVGFGFVPANFRRFDVVVGDQILPVSGRMGDRPALNMTVNATGLAQVVHVTRDYTLTYKDRATFERFCAHKAIEWACAAHDTRGLDPDVVRERYTRYGKSLVALGDGLGQDQPLGLRTEITAGANPYTDDLSDGLPLQVTFEGAPRAGAQVELFEKAPDGTVEVRLYTTDPEGRVLVDVKPGHSYLADAVKMLELDPDGDGPAWHSLWASLTFALPD
ncbi:DUF4198 domain-containing protein [Sagittula sp. SSi028]|uniref:DUF4198 domain-containing protein n=1 Tax=Sagittula sp. SSi028 TaxID=3400636 RepID=UPI003AF41C39